MDTLVEARWIVPVEPPGEVLEDHALAIEAGRIAGILPVQAASERYPHAERVTLDSHLLAPGLVNAHTHAAMTLLRGVADDLPLMDWLNGHVWPAERRWVGPEFVRAGVELALAEMIRGGTTCFGDMYFFPDQAAAACAAAGMRARIGIVVIDFPSAWARDADEYLKRGLAQHDHWKADDRIGFMFAPHAGYTVGDGPLSRIRQLADELDMQVHMHLHESEEEIMLSLESDGCRPLERLAGLGMLDPSLTAVHMTRLELDEVHALGEAGVSVVHCPQSNLKLASGFCPVTELASAGVNVALGTDGAASNNDLDMIEEMRTAALLAKGITGDASALPAHEALRMATLNGARALGIGDETGSLVEGKWADLVAVDLDAPCTRPVHDPVSALVHSAHRGQVSDVWVGGRALMRDSVLLTLDERAVLASADAWAARMHA